MNNAVGIFADRRSAQAAWEKLRRADFKDENLVMLTPEQSPDQVETIATEDAEQPGMGKAIGSIAGGAVGLAGGAIVGSLLLPGVGPILAIGLGAGVLGLGGAVAGGAGGEFFERDLYPTVSEGRNFFF